MTTPAGDPPVTTPADDARALAMAITIRDVPASCTCGWRRRAVRAVRVAPDPGCPWHTGRYSSATPHN